MTTSLAVVFLCSVEAKKVFKQPCFHSSALSLICLALTVLLAALTL